MADNQPLDPSIDVEAVLLGMQDGSASRDDLARLEEELRKSPETRSLVCRFLVDDSLIRDESGDERRVLELQQAASAPRPDAARPTLAGRGRGLFDLINRHGLVVAMVAATLLAALALQNFVISQRLDSLHELALVDDDPEKMSITVPTPGRPISAEALPGERVIGRVTGLEGVVWDDPLAEITFGETVYEGRSIRLAEGVVELLLTSGAKVTIQGPAHFEASSLTESTLQLGKLAAAVPRAARGYTVITPTSEVVDIGTQFGVMVEATGDSELHVFDGDVVARSRLTGASPELLYAHEKHAMRFGSKSERPDRFAANVEGFVRRVGPQLTADQTPPLPVTDALGLWYCADTLQGVEEGARVSAWRDILIGDNQFADDAWQFDERRCPTLVHDEAGRRALRFDGWSTSLATSPMETSPQQTLLVAYAPGPTSFANDARGGMLLKYPAAPSIELSVFKDRSTRAWVWPGPGSKGNVGIVTGAPVERLGVTTLAYVYDSEAGFAELWSDGVRQGRADAPVTVQQTGRRFIGNHSDLNMESGFFGNIYEIIIYDKALDEPSLASVNRYLAKRYSINSEP